MNLESLLPVATSIIGGFFIGALIGYFVKKIVKIVTFVSGAIVALLLFLQQQQLISVDIDRLQDSLSSVLISIGPQIEKMTQIGDTTSLGIPITASLTAGFTLGFAKS